MKFTTAPLDGAWVITLDSHIDERGSFARTFCRKEFEEHDIKFDVVQCNSSFNTAKGTLRGIHFQKDPYAEPKLVRCVSGALYDVIVDMRSDSPTYLQYYGVELSEENQKSLFIPANFAHGFLTLCDNTEAFYMMGEFYRPECAGGMRYDDPSLNIDWPFNPVVISEKDRTWPLLRTVES